MRWIRNEKGRMEQSIRIVGIILAAFLFIGVTGFVSDKDLPVIKGRKVVALVNGEPITLDELNDELTMLHQGVKGREKVGKEQISNLLRRLINTRLIVQEGRRMGLDELKELKERVDVFAKVTLRDELIERQIKDIKPDEKVVEELYKESIKEWKIKAILFEKEEDAKNMEGLLREGKDFDETLKKFLTDKKGKGNEEGIYQKNKELQPEIAEALSKMQVGSTSPVLRIKVGVVIFKLEDIRFPEDLKIRKEVELEVLRQRQTETFLKYDKTLKAKYVRINQELLKSLDFESKEPGFEKLLKDRRVLAEVKGEKPITVGEFTEYLKQQLFHGVEKAVESKRLNKRKDTVLDEMLQKRVLRKEALRLGIDKTETYKNKVKEEENGLIFGAFVKKAVAPEIKIKEEVVKTYYEQHIKEYTYPEMMKIDGLVFLKRDDAEKALTSLRQGTEYQWLKANAEGQVDKSRSGVLDFDGNLLTTKDLPEEVQKAVSGAKSGDFRLYESPKKYFYVLSIQEVIPPQPQPYSEAREKIANKIYGEKIIKAIEEYADKIRAVSEVKVYLKEN